MPIIKSAKKRAKQSEVRRQRNLVTKQNMRNDIKALEAAISGGKKADIEKAYKKAQSSLDVAVKKNVIHPNKAARKKSQLNAKVKASTGTKKAAPKKTTAKTETKKS